MNRFIILFFCLCFLSLEGKIVKTDQIEDVLKEIDQNSLVLFNIAEVLMDTQTSLGTQAWRKYIRSRLDSKQHDALTLFVFEKVPPKTPEPATASVVAALQKKGILTFGLTSRGKDEWYQTKVSNIDLLTEKLLRQIHIDFSKTSFKPSEDPFFKDFYHDGIIYATNAKDKGDIVTQFLNASQLKPSKVIVVDDKGDSIAEVERAIQAKGIPFFGLIYSRTAKEHANFNPMIANIQLERLISTGQILSDGEAEEILLKRDSKINAEEYFNETITKFENKNSH